MISITGLDPAAVIAALYNASRPLGMGFLHCDANPMTADEARPLVGERLDYLKGRVMKVCITGDEFSELGFDRDNGTGAAANAVDALRATCNPNAADIAKACQSSPAAMVSRCCRAAWRTLRMSCARPSRQQ